MLELDGPSEIHETEKVLQVFCTL